MDKSHTIDNPAIKKGADCGRVALPCNSVSDHKQISIAASIGHKHISKAELMPWQAMGCTFHGPYPCNVHDLIHGIGDFRNYTAKAMKLAILEKHCSRHPSMSYYG